MYKARQRIKLLDSMRGLAAAVVVFHHTFTQLPWLFNSSIPSWLRQVFEAVSGLNVQAVLFFFFLSGFSICLGLNNELPVTKAAFNNYVYRRLKRIMPLYYFAIFSTLCFGFFTNTITANEDYNAANLLGNIFFLQCSKSYSGNWFAPYGENGPLWSLSFEMFYYFFLPPFLLLLLKAFHTRVFTIRLNRIALIITLVISLGCMVINKLFYFPFIAFASLFYVWYAGFFTANLYKQNQVKAGLDFLLMLALTGLLLVINYAVPSATTAKLLFGSFIATVFTPLFMLRQKMQTVAALIFDRPVNFLFYRIGTGSYALYLLHFPVILALKHFNCQSLPFVLLMLAITVVTCIWLEKLFSRRSWLLFKRKYI